MDVSAWHRRWEEGRIGFHQEHVNPQLVRHWDSLGLRGHEQVLVPLCGASLDLRWLAGRGHSILGVEVSPVAVSQFFRLAHMNPDVYRRDGFTVHGFGAVEIWCGDFFDLRFAHTRGIRALYDRAALVALQADDRERYARHLAELLAPGSVGLLVSLEIEAGELPGPPFSVGDEEVRRIFEPDFEVRELEGGDVTADSKNLVDRGAERIVETVYELQRKPDA